MRLTRLIVTASLIFAVVFLNIAPLSAQSTPTITLMLTIPTSLSDVYSAKFIGEFENTHPGIKVQVNKQNPSIPSAAAGLDAHFTAVQNYVTTGDVVYVTTGVVSAEDTRAGYYVDLSSFVNDDKNLNTDDFYPTIWQSYQWDKGIWAIPVSADPFVLIYNPDAFDKAGIAYPSSAWTADDLINNARKFTIKESDKVTPGIDLLSGQGFAFRSIIKSSILDTSVVPNAPSFSAPELRDLMDKWLALDNEGAVGSDLVKAPLSIAPAILLALKSTIPAGEKRSAALLPGGQAALSVDGFAISGGTQYPEQAYALASWLSLRGEASNSGLASTPARKSMKNASGSDQVAFKLDVQPDVQAVIDQAVANAIPLSEMRFTDYVTTAYTKMKSDKLDAKSALQQIESDATKAEQQATTKHDTLKTSLVMATPIPAANAGAGKITLKFAVANNAPQIPNKDAWTKVINDFTASDPNVGAITLDSSSDPLEKIAASHDCFFLPYNGLTPDKLPKIIALDPFLAADTTFDKTDMVNGVMAQVTRDNKVYALPADILPEILKYDVDGFSKAGVTAPSLDWTTNQFADALKQLKSANSDKTPFIPQNTFGSYILNLITAYGGLPIDYRTTPPTISFTDPATLDAITQVTDLAKNGYLKYHTLFSGQLDVVIVPEISPIRTSALSSYTLSGLFLGMEKGQNLKVTLYPRGSKYSAVTYSIGSLYISANTTNPEACYRWISTVAKNPNLFTGMPARRSLIADPALATAQGADTVALYKQIDTLLQDPNTISLPAFSAGTAINDQLVELELFKALDKYLAKDSSVGLESVLTDAQNNATAFTACSTTLPPLDMTSTDSQKAYFTAAKACAIKADPDLAVFFAGVKTN